MDCGWSAFAVCGLYTGAVYDGYSQYVWRVEIASVQAKSHMPKPALMWDLWVALRAVNRLLFSSRDLYSSAGYILNNRRGYCFRSILPMLKVVD